MVTVSGPGRCHTWPIGALVSTQSGQAGGDIRDVAVGVWQVRVADEVGALGGNGVAKDWCSETGLGSTSAEKVRSAPDGDAHPTALCSIKQLHRHGRSGPAFGGRGREVGDLVSSLTARPTMP